ncbi:hypothetical protein PtA15_9A5 [Puccinia triticina]|uniref:Uncharacterized protein n=1 Tax=Puccinia triticina TaxID=208348 RepID=A0ABY7CUU4_9BASI|nr:uncharacterized protein PtA15_9A5 [Puccinia triticina]WAQ87881.1 hypothetical protein PtA15_9A5 [Puccinia triticina]
MWSSNNRTNSKRLTPNLKQLKLVAKVPESQPTQSPQGSDSSSTAESATSSSTWRKELRLTRVVERERKKLSTLEVVENMFSARKQMFDLLGKDSERLNLDLQKEIKRDSQAPQPSEVEPVTTIKPIEQTEPTPAPSELVATTEDPKGSAQASDDSAAAGWGGYFKKLW